MQDSPAILVQDPPVPGTQAVYPDVVAEIESLISHAATKQTLIADFLARVDMGIATYGDPLCYDSVGRDFRIDAYQELLDAVHYLMTDDKRRWLTQIRYLLALSADIRRTIPS